MMQDRADGKASRRGLGGLIGKTAAGTIAGAAFVATEMTSPRTTEAAPLQYHGQLDELLHLTPEDTINFDWVGWADRILSLPIQASDFVEWALPILGRYQQSFQEFFPKINSAYWAYIQKLVEQTTPEDTSRIVYGYIDDVLNLQLDPSGFKILSAAQLIGDRYAFLNGFAWFLSFVEDTEKDSNHYRPWGTTDESRRTYLARNIEPFLKEIEERYEKLHLQNPTGVQNFV